MKTELIEPKSREIKFPLIAKWNKDENPFLIVLFTSKNSGTVLVSKDPFREVGMYQDTWIFNPHWEILPPDYKVILSND